MEKAYGLSFVTITFRHTHVMLFSPLFVFQNWRLSHIPAFPSETSRARPALLPASQSSLRSLPLVSNMNSDIGFSMHVCSVINGNNDIILKVS